MTALERLTAIAEALPEGEVTPMDRHARLAVRDRTFAWYTDDHHGDGIVGVTVKATPEEGEMLLASAPERFHRPSYLGRRGWIALRLDTPEVDWDEVADLVTGSYRLVAPKRLVARL
jgi:predicted DNA-binding protein (MmcQ/YjbR family)